MNIDFNPQIASKPIFKSNNRIYRTANFNTMGTITRLFREDMFWPHLAEIETNLFENKDKVNIIQVGSSDGSEGYTQIISLLEFQQNKNNDKFFPIKAYDIDSEIINAANSRLLNITESDKKEFEKRRINFNKYFSETDKKLDIKGEYIDYSLGDEEGKTYAVNKILLDKIKFEKADMFDVVSQIEDNSNTILLCRNVLGYFKDKKIEEFIKKAAEKLKTNSILCIGKIDNDRGNARKFLTENQFQRVFYNIYKKI